MARVFPTGSEAATHAVAAAVAAHLVCGDVVALEGTLGAGKTVFVRGVCEALGVPASDGVSSPTYALVNLYPGGRHPIAHLDLYRVTAGDELEALGFRDLLDGESIVLVEWPERAAEVMELATVRVLIEDLGPSDRVLRIEGLDEELAEAAPA